MIIKEYDIQNLDCAACSSKIESEINNLEEVSSANLDFMNKRLVVQYNEDVESALERLNAIVGKIEPGVLLSPKGLQQQDSDSKPWFIIVAILILTLSLFLPPTLSIILGIAAYLIAGHRVLNAAYHELFTRQIFAEHFLMTIATLGAMYLGEFTEAIAVMILYEIGQYLEGRAIGRSRLSINSMLALKPEIAHRKTTLGITDVRVSDVGKGETVLVYAGERVPLDGRITKGESTVDTSSLTGEAEPVFVSPGSDVYAGFVNSHTLLEMEVTGTEAESMISRILNMIENASARKSAPEKFMTRFARYYTPAVVFSALLVFLIPTLLGFSSAIWLKRALIFLIVSCPCALVISIPLSYYIGIGMAAKKGIILKGSVYLDLLRKVHTLVFDKTGTLTTGELKVSEVKPAAGIDQAILTESLFLSEYTSTHPFAKAIKANFSGEFKTQEVQAFSEYPGKGVLLQYGEDKRIAGSEAFLRSFGYLTFCDPGTKSVVHAIKNDIYLGCITFDDEIKPGLNESLTQLKLFGIKHFSMLSGDRLPKAEQVAKELNLDSFHAELLPADKLSMLETIIANTPGIVAYCGDGLNDAPVLARADLGIAMGKVGAQASIETADIVLLNDRPEQLSAAFQLSRQTNRLVWQNVGIALGVKIIIMSLGMAGLSGLWEAIIADVGVTLFVIFNSLRMMKTKHD